MKIQYLAVVFIIIMLPISLILSEYTKGQIQTLQLQISYDSKLDTATHDAVKAYQLNSANSDTSDIADSKIRDIEASINTFFNSNSNFLYLSYLIFYIRSNYLSSPCKFKLIFSKFTDSLPLKTIWKSEL